MASTVLQMITPVVRELGEDITDATSVQQFVDWTADALAEINSETGDWTFLHGVQTFSTSPGVSTYSLGTLVAEIKGVVRGSNNVRLDQITELELGDRGYNIEETGSPRAYLIVSWVPSTGPSIRLWPTPTTTENITVYRSTDPAAIVSTTVLEVPNAFFHVLRDHIRSSYYASADRSDLYDRYRQKYNVGIGNLRKRFAYTRDNDLTFQARDIPKTGGVFRDAQLPDTFQRT